MTMPIHGYILVDGEKWLVSTRERKTRQTVKRRQEGEDGAYLDDVQALLEQPEHRWLLDPLRYGTPVHLPSELRDHPTPPAASGD
jgi:hypothetical protein